MSLLLCTWNLGCKDLDGQMPKEGDFDWLAKLFKETQPEVLALGIQELHPNLLPKFLQDVQQVWKDVHGQELQATAEHCDTYLPLLLFQRTANKVEVVPLHFTFGKHQVCSKGCVAAHFDHNGLKMCVVNAHLEAGHGKVRARNEMFAQIASTFPTGSNSLMLLLGDLNYRVEGKRPFTEPTKATPVEQRCQVFLEEFDEAVAKCQAGKASELQERCQLRRSRGDAPCFENFEEAEVRFQPTYKRVKASESDVSKGIPRFDCDQPRMPGWCDRILWRRAADVEVKVLDYLAIESADYSDHRPVCAVLEVGRLSS